MLSVTRATFRQYVMMFLLRDDIFYMCDPLIVFVKIFCSNKLFIISSLYISDLFENATSLELIEGRVQDADHVAPYLQVLRIIRSPLNVSVNRAKSSEEVPYLPTVRRIV